MSTPMSDMPDMPSHHDHGDMGSSSCKMSMLLTWDYEDSCILSSSWHIHNTRDLFFSILFTIALSAGYELFKKKSQIYITKNFTMSPSSIPLVEENSRLLTRRLRVLKFYRSILYAIRVFYSFMLMLVFMSFNWWIILSVVFGSGLGYFLFENNSDLIDDKTTDSGSLACH
ncbi:hypothetical protein PACTADRAFT_2842 [Pachysolen tannophilus NRRL Y-2460]|uniref:Copper transport protein n=1 Tax=Pachysolen tannophilus NRRL Y-2460 TaxID=669874 RepID=A0A1E4TTP4_PACTA|nr:hypothetical protein PACTADRAFT_2842 [Pachysolen tannophilus NRRL Y-2460]